eukprot:jgi/Bigna1/68342/fgenesh1_pg.6_\
MTRGSLQFHTIQWVSAFVAAYCVMSTKAVQIKDTAKTAPILNLNFAFDRGAPEDVALPSSIIQLNKIPSEYNGNPSHYNAFQMMMGDEPGVYARPLVDVDRPNLALSVACIRNPSSFQCRGESGLLTGTFDSYLQNPYITPMGTNGAGYPLPKASSSKK